MRAGRIALLFGLVLLAVALASASRPRETQVAVPGAEEDPARPAAAIVEAVLPRDGTVRATRGDVVRLRVGTGGPDRARIPRLGLQWPVGPGLAGEVTFVADRPGRFRVGLRSGPRVGVLVVER